jgi:hypothetical protein
MKTGINQLCNYSKRNQSNARNKFINFSSLQGLQRQFNQKKILLHKQRINSHTPTQIRHYSAQKSNKADEEAESLLTSEVPVSFIHSQSNTFKVESNMSKI